MKKLIFAYLSNCSDPKDLILAASIRKFGGSLSDYPIWVLFPKTEEIIRNEMKNLFLSLNVDLIPSLIDALEWALSQPCAENEDAVEIPVVNDEDAEQLASYIYRALSEHGIAVHWDFIERIALEDSAMERYTKWDLHYILTTRRDLFLHEGEGKFSINPNSLN